METRKTFKKEKQEIIIKEEQFNEYEIPLQSKTHYFNNGSGVNVKEEDMNQEMPVEEQFIEISTNTASKMDQTSNEKAKALTKDETRRLLDLILLHPIITSKETNATNNQQKIIEWHQIAEDFNATCSAYPRTPKQLRLKWENLKKNARRRSEKIRLNRGKTDWTAEYIPRDEILERVCTLLRRRPSNATAPSTPSQNDDSDDSDEDTPLVRKSLPVKRLRSSVTRDYNEDVLESTDPAASEVNAISHKTTNGFSALQMPSRKHKLATDEGREARNRAIADYYAAKTKLLDANLVNIQLQNEKLRLEVDLLKSNAQ